MWEEIYNKIQQDLSGMWDNVGALIGETGDATVQGLQDAADWLDDKSLPVPHGRSQEIEEARTGGAPVVLDNRPSDEELDIFLDTTTSDTTNVAEESPLEAQGFSRKDTEKGLEVGEVGDVADAPKSIYQEAVKVAENSVRAGWDKEAKVWKSHKSEEGGLHTIGYGHKFSTQAEVDEANVNGWTEEKALEVFQEDWDEAETVASNQYNNKYDTEFSDLSEAGKLALTEVVFNIGTLLNEDGEYDWTELAKAARKGDVSEMKNQISRTYTDEKGNVHTLTGRVNGLKDALDKIDRIE